jgi:DNA helicase-2/ATP-dependent DNA helicase PcrA
VVPDTPRAAAALLADLTAAQRRAVETETATLCVLAGAGAGKTRVVTRRIAYRVLTGSAQSGHVLALTFSRKAAGELGARLSGLGLRDRVTAGTFHAVAAAQLRQWWRDTGRRPLTLLDRKGRLLAPLAARRPALAGVDIAALAGQIEWAKSRLVAPAGFEAAAGGRALPAPAADIAALYERYEHEKTRRGLLDFDDLLARCVDALEGDASFAGAQRWRWRHFFVDEFQDLNPLQYRVLLAWLGPRDDLCAVGDPNQAIYGWNGADADLLVRFGDRWPEAEVVRLDDNHRCTPQVVAAAASVLGAAGASLRSSRPDGPPAQVRAYPSEAAEAHGVAGQLRQARATGLAWSHLAVLVRTNAQVVALRQALRAAGIPHRVPGGAALLDEPAVRAALDDLRGRAQLPFPLLLGDLDRLARGDEAPPPAGGGNGAVDAEADRTALGALAALAHEYEQMDPAPTVAAFTAWLPAAAGDDRAGDAGDAVTICSFHRAKGLEWPAVWVCGLEQGLVPLGRATGPGAEDEERRLLYVALTRAERELRCSWAETRSFGGHAVRREPSQWLAAIAGKPAGAAEAPSGQGQALDAEAWRLRLSEQRRRLAEGRSGPAKLRRGAALSDPDPLLVEELRTWRAERARAAGVPAHVLLHDRTLHALASLRPCTDDQLLAVPGLGPVKVARFGPSLLALVDGHRETA